MLQTLSSNLKNPSSDRSACFSRIIVKSRRLFSANIRMTLPESQTKSKRPCQKNMTMDKHRAEQAETCMGALTSVVVESQYPDGLKDLPHLK